MDEEGALALGVYDPIFANCQICVIKYNQAGHKFVSKCIRFDKGKPIERWGRKATGLSQ